MARRRKISEKPRPIRPDPHSADWVTIELLVRAGIREMWRARLDFDAHRRAAMLIAFRCPTYNREAWKRYMEMTPIERIKLHTRLSPANYNHVFEDDDDEPDDDLREEGTGKPFVLQGDAEGGG